MSKTPQSNVAGTFDVPADVSVRFYVYILYSLKDNKLYIGFTNNLKKRLTEHATGKVEATKNRLPIKLIHYEYFINREDAEAREKYLKTSMGRRVIRKQISHYLEREGKIRI